MPIGKLTVAKVKTRAPGRYGDGGGLWLCVGPNSKSWVFRYMIGGKAREMGLGSFDDVGLAEAREAARLCRARVHQKPENGGPVDPLAERQAAEITAKVASAKVMTFRECAKAYVKAHRDGWKSAVHAHQWVQSLEAYAYPLLGNLPVGSIDTALVVKTLEPNWLEKTETMSRVRGRVESVLGWATVRGFRQGDNPARWKGHLDNLLPAKTKVKAVEHFAALDYRQIGAFMEDLRRQNSIPAAALEFLILTAMRSKPIIGARWEEIDLKNRVWTVEDEDMKSGVQHTVPLSDQAVAVLNRMAQMRRNDFVFPGRNGKLNKDALFALLRRMGRGDLTAHGFRSTFRDWAGNRTNYSRDLAEEALAHQIGDATERAYAREPRIEKRRPMMRDWATFCDAPAAAGESCHSVPHDDRSR
jgi:integrase